MYLKHSCVNVVNTVYETFHYNPNQITIVRAKIGRTLKLDCPINADNHIWFRAGGEVILSPETKKHIGILNITSVKTSDLGTYYCGSQKLDTNDDEELSVGLLLSVQKFILMANGSAFHIVYMIFHITARYLEICLHF